MPVIPDEVFTLLVRALLLLVYAIPGMLLLLSMEDSDRFRPHLQRAPWLIRWWSLWAWPLSVLWVYLRGRHGHER